MVSSIRHIFRQAAAKVGDSFNVAFKKAFTKGPQVWSSAALIEAIKRERPDLEHETFYSPDYGSSAHTLIAGEEVFKGPKSKFSVDDLQGEWRVQQHLHDQGLAVAPVTHVGKKAIFFGMKRMPGVVVKQVLSEMNEVQKADLAKELGEFCAGIASAFAHEAPDGVRMLLPVERALAVLETVEAREVLGRDYGACRREVTAFSQRMENRKQIKVNIDMNSANILVDPVTKKLSAVLDFGLMDYRYPEIEEIFDKSGLSFDKAFCKQVWEAYAQKSGVDVRDPDCYWLCIQLRNLHHAVEHNKKFPASPKDIDGQYRPHILAALYKVLPVTAQVQVVDVKAAGPKC